ncbi:hypothetical protein BMS3Bbin04_01597 [bacterium BMS3Bbin04]|nr:hypothetical protein BMS3Bbin04_01597 [bacterium BMS3Bbin04]
MCAQLLMVALLRLFQTVQVLLQILFGEKGGAIYALQHRVGLTPPPVRTRHTQQLECADLACTAQMRPTAQVSKIILSVEAELLTFQTLDQLTFELSLLRSENFFCLVVAYFTTYHRIIRRDDLPHLGFDGLEVFVGQTMLQVEIVVESILDGRSDSELDIVKQTHHRLSHYMSCGVTQHVQ